jgi:hypothetical protein
MTSFSTLMALWKGRSRIVGLLRTGNGRFIRAFAQNIGVAMNMEAEIWHYYMDFVSASKLTTHLCKNSDRLSNADQTATRLFSLAVEI